MYVFSISCMPILSCSRALSYVQRRTCSNCMCPPFQSVHKYVTQEYVRACLVSYDSLPKDVYHEGWGRPGSSRSRPHFLTLTLSHIIMHFSLICPYISLTKMENGTFRLPVFMDRPHVVIPFIWLLFSWNFDSCDLTATKPALNFNLRINWYRRYQIQWNPF